MSAITEPVPEPAEGSTDYDPVAEFEEIWQAAYAAAVTDPKLTEDQINADAQAERVARMGALAKHSASQLVPNAADHEQINRLLDEWDHFEPGWGEIL